MARASREPKKKESPAGAAAKPRRGGALQPALLGLWALVVVPPLVFNPYLTDNFRLPKLMVSEVAVLLSLALLVPRLADFASRRWDGDDLSLGWRGKLEAWWQVPAVKTLLPMLLAGTVAALLSAHGIRAVEATPSLWIAVVALMVWSVTLEVRELRLLLGGVTVMAGAVAFFGILQFHGLAQPFGFQGQVTDRLAMTSLAGGAFDVAGYVLLPALVAQAWLAGATTWRVRGAAIALLALFAYAVALSQTLTVVVGLGLGSALFWSLRLGRKVAPLLGGLAVLVVIALFAIGPLRSRVQAVGEDVAAGRFNEMLSGRLDGWRGAWWMFGQHPVAGVGHGAYRSEYGDAKLALAERGVEFFAYHRSAYFVNAHNDLLEAAAEWGLLGLAALGWALWQLGRRMVGRWRRDPHGVRISFEIGALAAVVPVALGNFPFHVALIAYPFLLLLADLLAAEPGESGDRPGSGRPSPWWPALIVLLLVITGWRAWYWYEIARARGAATLVERSVNSALAQSQGHMPARLLMDSVAVLEKSLARDPGNLEARVTLAGHLFLMHRFEQSQKAYGEALALEKRAEIYANLVRVCLAAGDVAQAEAHAATAIKLDPQLEQPLQEILRRQQQRTAPRPASTGPIFHDSFEDGGAQAWSGRAGGQHDRPS